MSPHLTATSVAAVAVLGIIGTGFADVLNYQIITSEGAAVAPTVAHLLPVVPIVLGVLVLNENVTATILGGIALLLAGVALMRRGTAALRTVISVSTRTFATNDGLEPALRRQPGLLYGSIAGYDAMTRAVARVVNTRPVSVQA